MKMFDAGEGAKMREWRDYTTRYKQISASVASQKRFVPFERTPYI